VKRRGNRRYYQHHEVLLIRRIRDLLYEQGFTINGARHRLDHDDAEPRAAARAVVSSSTIVAAPPPSSSDHRPAVAAPVSSRKSASCSGAITSARYNRGSVGA
jgi:DNA-binding transcriptional MerR regulator